MELLEVTWVQVNALREADALTRMRVITDTVRNAPGLLNARFYRSKEPGMSYCLLTTWESNEWWQKAQERHAPRTLLLDSPPGIFQLPPEQWLMRYLWGYSRPRAQPVVAAAHLAMVRPDMAEQVQPAWLEGLHRQAAEPLFSFAMLARSLAEQPAGPSSSAGSPLGRGQLHGPPAASQPGRQSTMFFNLLSWPGEKDREAFYRGADYQQIQGLLSRTGMLHILLLDPM